MPTVSHVRTRVASAALVVAASAALATAAPAAAADASAQARLSCTVAVRDSSGAFVDTGETLTPDFQFLESWPTSTDHSQFRIAVATGGVTLTGGDFRTLAPYGLNLESGAVSQLDLRVTGGTPTTVPVSAAPIALKPGVFSPETATSGFPIFSNVGNTGYIIRTGGQDAFTVVDLGHVVIDFNLAVVPGGATHAVRASCDQPAAPSLFNWHHIAVVGANGTGGNQPKVIEMSATSGSTDGGTVVRATFSNLPPFSRYLISVTVGDQVVKPLGWVGPTVEFKVPANTAGTKDVRLGWLDDLVSADNGAVDNFTYVQAPPPTTLPVLTRVSPKGGFAKLGGVTVITGLRLDGVTQVRFGHVAAKTFFLTAGSIIAFAPPQAAGSVPVTVTAAAGTSRGIGAPRYQYIATP